MHVLFTWNVFLGTFPMLVLCLFYALHYVWNWDNSVDINRTLVSDLQNRQSVCLGSEGIELNIFQFLWCSLYFGHPCFNWPGTSYYPNSLVRWFFYVLCAARRSNSARESGPGTCMPITYGRAARKHADVIGPGCSLILKWLAKPHHVCSSTYVWTTYIHSLVRTLLRGRMNDLRKRTWISVLHIWSFPI